MVQGLDREALRAEAEAVGVVLTAAQVDGLAALASAVAGAGFNVTGLRSWADIRRKHFVDSLGCVRALAAAPGERVADLGSGAGFPGIPLAVVCPGTRFALLEANGRRATFLRGVVEALGLPSVVVIQARAEDLGRQAEWREQFDAVVARAVAPLATLAEWALPLTKVGGRVVALKGPRAGEELAAAGGGLEEMGGEVAAVHPLALPGGGEARVVVAIRKVRATPPRYPRHGGARRARAKGAMEGGGG